MDPALMNYIQSQQQEQPQGQQMSMQQMQMPQMQGQQAPQPQMNIPQSGQPQAPNNPFDSGIKRAIESARESLGMTQGQKDNAFQRGLFGFANRMGQEPVQSGFWNNFGAASRAIGSGMNEYNQAEDMALTQNNALANQILQYQNLQRAEEAKAEEQAWKREFAEDEQAWKRGYMENQLAEQQRYHNMKGNNSANGASVEFNGKLYQPLDAMGLRKAETKEELTGNAYLAVKEIAERWKNLDELTKGNVFQPIGGLSQLANPVKDYAGRVFGSEALEKETAVRKDMAAKLGALNTVLEGVKAGGGKLGQGMYDRLKLFFPDMEKDDLATIKMKFATISEEARIYYEAAKLSKEYGIKVNPIDVVQMEKANQNKPAVPQATGAPSDDDLGVILD